jgi:hypothetical protein
MRSGALRAVVAAALALMSISGCSAILEGDELVVSRHAGATRPEVTARSVEVRDFDELTAAIAGFVQSHDDTGVINVYGYSGEIDEDVARACGEIMENTPMGAYAVSDIAWDIARIVSYYEVEIDISYRRTRRQLEAMVTASSQRFLREELQDIMRRYEESAVIYTRLGDIKPDEVRGYIEEIYYANPLEIIMLPVVGVDVFPDHGSERIVEITLGQRNPSNISLTYTAALAVAARNIAETASGESDGELLLALLGALTDTAEYDADAARIGQYSTQNFNATAYGALVYGLAVGEGYAMAYKTLCDELGIECVVVLGALGANAHAWNIVRVGGDYYHIDAAMCDESGVEAAFLMGDADMQGAGYVWDSANYPPCSGPLTYADFLPEPDEDLESESGDAAQDGDTDGGESNAGSDTEGDTDEHPAQQPTPPDDDSTPAPPDGDDNDDEDM